MKQKFTFLIAALMLLVFMTPSMVGWGQTPVTVNASKVASSSFTWCDTDNTVTWSGVVNGGATNQNVTNGYAQVGTRNSPSTSITLTTSSIAGTITSVVINCASYNGLGNVSATVGGSAFGTQSQSIPKWSNETGGDITFNNSNGASGEIVVTMTNGSGGRAMYIKSISVTYTAGGGGSDTYTVTYDANGGSGTMTDENSPYISGSTVTVLGNVFTLEGYEFSSWNTKSDGSGSFYDPDDTFTITANTTLYAQWEVAKYNVALSSVANVDLLASYGSSSTIEEDGNANVAYGTEITLSATNMTAGTVFIWAITDDEDNDVTDDVLDGDVLTVPAYDVIISGEIVDMTYNNTYTSNVTLSTSGGTSASTCKVAISVVEYDGIKAGTGSVAGAWQVTVPANTTKLHLHLAGWNGENVTLSVAPSGYSNAIVLTANSGISGSGSTYTFIGDPSTNSYYKIITFADPLEEAVTLTFSASSGNRFVVWGVNAEASTNPYITADDVEIDDDETSGSITYTVHNIPDPAGTLTASTTSDWLTLGDIEENVPFTCKANPNAVERTATVTLTYSYGDDETTSLDVTVTQAPKVVTYTYTLATSIESGRHYILVGYEDATPYAMGAPNGNVRNAISITDEGDDVVSFTSDKGVREIVINGPEIITKNDKPVEVYTLYDAAASGYVYASSNTSNNIGTRPYNTGADSQWKIVFDEENSNFVVTAQGTNSRNILKYNYNSGNPRFSCYSSGTSLTTLLYLYVKNEVTPQYDFYKDITAATNWSTASNGWYFIASPVNGNINPDNVDNMLTADENEYHTYDLYRLSGNTLENFRNENFVIANGTGYLYANKNITTLKFSGTSIKEYNNVNNTITPPHSGWNLIGNPYTFPVKVSRAFSELNYGSAVTSKEVNSVINPGAGIIVYGTGTVTFTKYVPNEQSSGPSNINIMLAQQVASRDGSSTTSVAIDNAVVSFNSNSRLPKFTLLEGNAKLYIPQNGEDYAIAFSNRQGDMPLNFKTTETGNYTISFEGNNMNLRGIYLIDMLAGQEIDLSVNPSYTFIGSPVDKAERFKIVFKNVGSNGEDIFAYQNGNDIIVSGEGELQIFDVTGRSVMTTTISGVETINVPTMGVYIFRLIGSEIKTQKIVVR